MGEARPVELLIERDHGYKKKPARVDVVKGKRKTVQPPGCLHCNGAKFAPPHLGAPPSLNEGGSGRDRDAYQTEKRAWMRVLAEALERSGLPRGLEAVMVEAQIGFGTRLARDEGNLRWMVEKALGDVLVSGYWELRPLARIEDGDVTKPFKGADGDKKAWVRVVPGGWLEDDCFYPRRRYSFGGMTGVHAPGRSFLRLVLFPSTIEPENVAP